MTPGVDHDLPGPRDGVEEQLVAVDLDGQERLIGVEPDGGQRRSRASIFPRRS